MKTIKILLFFIFFLLFLNLKKDEIKTKYNSYVEKKNKDKVYQEMYSKYVPYSQKNLLKNDIKKKIPFTKEIVLSEECNKKMFKKKKTQKIIKYIFKGIQEKKIKAYKNSTFTQKLSTKEINERMLIPKDIERISPKAGKNIYFSYNDIKIIEIDGFYIETIQNPSPVFDNLVLKLIIPAEIFDNMTQHIVFFLKYEECLQYLSSQNFKIIKEGKNIDCKKAFDKNFFNFRYIFVNNIDINEKFKIKKKNTKENHFYAQNIFLS